MNPYHRTMRADARHLQSLAVAPIKVIAALATLVIATVSAADVRPLASRPHAVRGEPLLVPITVEGSVRESISVRLESVNEPTSMRGTPSANTPRGSTNQTVSARILWPNRAVNQGSPAASVDDQSTRARWATACNDLRLSSARQSGARDAYLAIDVPIDARDGLRIIIDGATVSPVLHDAASVTLLTDLAVRASALVPSGALDPLLSLPDPLAPFERFRFEIGGALRGWNKPNAFVRASPDDIAARATSALWRAALARIAASSVGTATELAELLVAQCQDEFASAPIAAWIADPRELGALLALIFDPSRSNEQMVEGIVSWMRVRAPLLVWIDNDDSESITLACNGSRKAMHHWPRWLRRVKSFVCACRVRSCPPSMVSRSCVAKRMCCALSIAVKFAASACRQRASLQAQAALRGADFGDHSIWSRSQQAPSSIPILRCEPTPRCGRAWMDGRFLWKRALPHRPTPQIA